MEKHIGRPTRPISFGFTIESSLRSDLPIIRFHVGLNLQRTALDPSNSHFFLKKKIKIEMTEILYLKTTSATGLLFTFGQFRDFSRKIMDCWSASNLQFFFFCVCCGAWLLTCLFLMGYWHLILGEAGGRQYSQDLGRFVYSDSGVWCRNWIELWN